VSLVVGCAIVFGEELAALAGAVGVAGEGENLGVVHQPVDHGCGDDVVGKGFAREYDEIEYAALPVGAR
jgi:hypothetical protein